MRKIVLQIARIMQTGWFKEVRVKDLDSHSVRALLATIPELPHVAKVSAGKLWNRNLKQSNRSVLES
jgi:hypothetical protein